MHVIQWIIFRGVGHAQIGQPASPFRPPPVACGRTAWPGLLRYDSRPPKHVCEDCAAALGIDFERRAAVKASRPEPPKPEQGSLFS